MEQQPNIAIFIDAENIDGKCAQFVFETALAQGTVLFKRIYADWRREHLANWESAISNYSIKAMQCFAFAKGKNSSDMLMVTDILEILYEKKIDIFAIVSSDSDFTNVVQKLRESGKKVLGFGKKANSATSYINSFNEFFYIDNDSGADDGESAGANSPKPIRSAIIHNIEGIAARIIDERGRAEYSLVRDEIVKIYPNFVPRNYGYTSFRALLRDGFLPHVSEKYEESVAADGFSYYLQKKVAEKSAAKPATKKSSAKNGATTSGAAKSSGAKTASAKTSAKASGATTKSAKTAK